MKVDSLEVDPTRTVPNLSLKVDFAESRSVKSCPNIVARKLAQDINTEIVMKTVHVRAVELSIGPFCTEFRCEQLCDNEVSGIGVDFWAPRHKHRNGHESGPRESCEPLDRTILHRISVRTFL